MKDPSNDIENDTSQDKTEQNLIDFNNAITQNNKEQSLTDSNLELENTDSNKKTSISRKSRKHFRYRSNKCLNCKQPLDLSDRYCPYCSQLNSTKQLEASDFFGEFVNSIVSFDSRLRYTLKDLLFKPGTITRNYVNGQRLKYANPFRFFLSVSIIYFLLSGLFNEFYEEDTISKEDKVEIEKANTDLHIGLFDISVKNNNENNNKPAIKTDSITIKDEKAGDTIKYISQNELDALPLIEETIEKIETYNKFYEETKIKSAEEALQKLGHSQTKFNSWLYNKNEVIEDVSNNPNDFMTYLVNKIPFFLFFFTPFYALFFLVLYYKKKVTYMEHMIFIFHVFSFVFLTQLICFFPDQLLGGKDVLSSIILVFVGPFYFYKALRNFYKQSRVLTIFKFMLLNLIFWFGAGISAVFFFVISAAVY